MTSFERFSEFNGRNAILFHNEVFGKQMKETTLVAYFIKVTTRPSLTRLRIIREINRVH